MINKRFRSVIFIVAAVIAGYCIYQYSGLFSAYKQYYGYYSSVNGLQGSSPVYMQGVQIGRVADIVLEENRLKVIYDVHKHVAIRKGVIARIESDGLTGGAAVFMKPGTGALLPEKTLLSTDVDTSMVDQFHSKISPFVTNGIYMLRTADSTLKNFNYLLVSGWGTRTQQEISRFRQVLGNIEAGTNKANEKTQSLTALIIKADRHLNSPSATNQNINEKLRQADAQSTNAATTDISAKLSNISTSLNGLLDKISRLKANKLLGNKEPYQNLSRSLDTLNQNLKTLKEDPPRNFHFWKEIKQVTV